MLKNHELVGMLKSTLLAGVHDAEAEPRRPVAGL